MYYCQIEFPLIKYIGLKLCSYISKCEAITEKFKLQIHIFYNIL